MTKKKNSASRKSIVFEKITVSYIALIIIAVLTTGSIAYFKTYSIVYGNIQEANLGSIKNLEQKMDTFLQETDSVSLSLQGWPSIRKIFTMTGELDKSWVSDEELFNLVYVLRKHKALHSYIDNIAIVFRDVDLVIDCTSASSDYEEFFEYRYSFAAENFRGIDDLDFTKDSLLLTNCKVGKYSQPNQECLLYFKAIPNSTGVSKAMLLVTLKPETMTIQLNSNVIFEDEMWLIQNGDGEVILSNTAYTRESLSHLPTPENAISRTGYADWQGKHCAYYSLYSEKLAQSFYTFFPLNNITRQFAGTILFTAVSLVITIALGILLAYRFARKSYAPIQIIEESLLHLTSENDALRESISSHMPIIHNNLLNKLLSSTHLTAQDREDLEKYSIRFPHPWFFVSVISVEAMSLRSDEEFIASPASNALFFSCLDEYFSGGNTLFYLAELQNTNNSYALIVNCTSENPEPFRPLFTRLPEFIRRKFSREVEIDISIGISRICKEPINLKALYYQALSALEYRYGLSLPKVVWHSDLKETPVVSYNFTINDELKLINLIKSGQKDEALAFTNTVLDDFFAQGRIRREDAIYIFNQILFICAKIIHETRERSADAVDFKQLHSLNLFTQMNEYTLSCVARTCDIINHLHKSSESELSERIVQYIKENFRNCDLTLTYLADYFHVSAIYASKAVKKVSDISFIDYLNRLRIDESKKLLTETNQNIRDIASQIGYDSDKNFIRVFKKYEGITPGQFRKI